MRERIVAAWKVLRGEWVARPPEPNHGFYVIDPNTYGGTSSSVTFTPVRWGQTG